jgi:hypothetical protein
MTTKPFPDPADGSRAVVTGVKETAVAPSKRASLLGSLGNQLPRVIGAGLLGLYLIALVEQLLAWYYNQNDLPVAGMALSVQLLEHSPFLLLGYALLFWPALEDPRGRSGRVALKLASHSALAACALQVGMGALNVWSGEQLFRRERLVLNIEAHNQVVLMERTKREAPTLGEGQLHLIYLDLAPGAKAAGKTPAIEVMRGAVAELAGSRIKEINADYDHRHEELVRQMLTTGGKYGAFALLGPVLFFLIWDQTPKMRLVQILAPSADPNLVLASRIARRFRRLQLWGEKLFTPPDLEKYRWYRHLRRSFQRRFKKK